MRTVINLSLVLILGIWSAAFAAADESSGKPSIRSDSILKTLNLDVSTANRGTSATYYPTVFSEGKRTYLGSGVTLPQRPGSTFKEIELSAGIVSSLRQPAGIITVTARW